MWRNSPRTVSPNSLLPYFQGRPNCPNENRHLLSDQLLVHLMQSYYQIKCILNSWGNNEWVRLNTSGKTSVYLHCPFAAVFPGDIQCLYISGWHCWVWLYDVVSRRLALGHGSPDRHCLCLLFLLLLTRQLLLAQWQLVSTLLTAPPIHQQ